MKSSTPTRSAPTTRTIESHAPTETTRIGERIGRALRSGDVLLLRGDLGAGKTQFARGVAAGLRILGPIPSPTFTLVNEYAGRNAAGEAVPLAHIDLYRLGDGGDLDSLGLEDYLSGAWAAVIEWPERAVDDGFVPAIVSGYRDCGRGRPGADADLHGVRRRRPGSCTRSVGAHDGARARACCSPSIPHRSLIGYAIADGDRLLAEAIWRGQRQGTAMLLAEVMRALEYTWADAG